MAFSDSARDQFPAIIPDDPATPTVPAHLQTIIDAVEAQVVLRADTWSWANTFLTPFEDGMLLYVEDVDELWARVDGEWRKLYPTTYTGTATPSDSLGADGDLYFQVDS